MVNHSDPVVIGRDTMVLKHFWHTMNGIWEFFTTLDYEWNVIRGRRPYRWTIWIYSITRVTTLAAVILTIVGMDVTTPYNCQIWISFTLSFGCVAFAAAALLIIFRIIAIWNRNIIAVSIAAGAWVTNVVLMFRGILRVRAGWFPSDRNCLVVNTEDNTLNTLATFTTDIVLLLIMLVGLIRLRLHGGGRFGLGIVLWKQGVTWLVIATAVEVPPVVLIVKNLNGPFNLMFQLPSLITMSIAATRMYRSLVDFVWGTTDIASDKIQNRDSKVSRTKSSTLRFNAIEVGVDRSYEHPHGSHYGSHVGVDGQLDDKSHGLGLED